MQQSVVLVVFIVLQCFCTVYGSFSLMLSEIGIERNPYFNIRYFFDLPANQDLLPYYCNHKSPLPTMIAVFTEVNSLPSPQVQPTLRNWDLNR